MERNDLLTIWNGTKSMQDLPSHLIEKSEIMTRTKKLQISNDTQTLGKEKKKVGGCITSHKKDGQTSPQP